jgi:hypothetical protein
VEDDMNFVYALFKSVPGESTEKLKHHRYVENAIAYNQGFAKYAKKRASRELAATRAGYKDMYKPTANSLRIPEYRKGLSEEELKR